MLKTVPSPKRDFDTFNATTLPCSPHTISFLDSANVRATKRVRTTNYRPEEINQTEHKTSNSDGTPNIWHSNWGIHAIDEDKFLEWIPKRSRTKYQRSMSRKDPVFSTEDVQFILSKAIEETKEIMKKQYDQVLQERLSEQYNHFCTYNQDHIHRKMETSQYDYMS